MSKKVTQKAVKKAKTTVRKKAAKNLPIPKFKVGQLVQINDGITCSDIEVMPLGGWVGKIVDVGLYRSKPVYNIVWTKETLAAAHPIYSILADEYDLREDEYGGLREDEIHLYEGGPLRLADPGDTSRFQNRAFSPESDKDRLRMVFGIKPLGPIPGPDTKSLQVYWQFLSLKLAFPFKAVYMHDNQWGYKKIPFVCEKIDDPKTDGDDMHGLFCRGKRQDGSRIICPLRDVDPIGLTKDQKEIHTDYCEWMC